MRSLRRRLEAALAWALIAALLSPLFAFMVLGLILALPFIAAGQIMLKREEANP